MSTPSSEQEIKEKVQRAHDAKLLWKSYGAKKRSEILRPLIAAFKAVEDDIALLTTTEMGKTITEAKANLIYDFEYLEDFLTNGPLYIEDEITYQKDKAIHKIIYEPHGVIASIAPWNFPFTNFVWSVIPHLIAGNTVVFKHSEYCPQVGKLCETVMNNLKDLPPGVFSEVYGDAHVGEILVNQNIDLIWFIGSSATGKKLFEIAGKKQIKAILEMGGSNPAIVFEDADIEKTVQKIYDGRFSNCGQVCDAIKRLIIHEKIYDKFVAQLCAHLSTVIIGDPLSPSTQFGPLVSMKQLHLLEAQVHDAREKGAHVFTGGTALPTSGAYYPPTLLTNITSDMRVWKEEVFGPVLPIVKFKDENQAIKLANDTPYGLCANIYSKDTERARRVARLLDVGSVNINEGSRWMASNPFGGVKASGMGCEHGRHGFQELCQLKVISEE